MARSRIVSVLALLVAGGAALLGGCASGTGSESAAVETPDDPSSGETDDQMSLQDFQAKCEDAAAKLEREVQIDWPRTLSTRTAIAEDYRLTVDANDTPLPATAYVTSGEAASTSQVRVSCRLQARLTAGDDHVTVTAPGAGQNEWIERSVNGAGLYQWTWSVAADRPGNYDLTAQIQPVKIDPYAPTSQILDLATDFQVGGNLIERWGSWLERTWWALVLLGGALVGVLTWVVTKVQPLVRRLRPGNKPAAASAGGSRPTSKPTTRRRTTSTTNRR